jgi:hypothetical protein
MGNEPVTGDIMPDDKTYTEVLLEVRDKLDEMEHRVVNKIDGVGGDVSTNREAIARLETKMDNVCDVTNRHERAIDMLKARDRNVTIISTVVASVSGVLSGIFGPRP